MRGQIEVPCKRPWRQPKIPRRGRRLPSGQPVSLQADHARLPSVGLQSIVSVCAVEEQAVELLMAAGVPRLEGMANLNREQRTIGGDGGWAGVLDTHCESGGSVVGDREVADVHLNDLYGGGNGVFSCVRCFRKIVRRDHPDIGRFHGEGVAWGAGQKGIRVAEELG